MIAAATGQALPLAWIPALVGVVTILVVVAKGSRLFGQAEAHLEAQDKTLARQDETLAAQNQALADLRDKLDDLRDRHTG